MASKALDNTQSNYAVIEKEMLAICFGCHKFHDYIFGKHVKIETDHKPLIGILNKPIHKLSARMQRMRMRLQNYNITVTHIKGSNMFFADTLSRAHTTQTEPSNLFDNTTMIAEIGFVDEHLEDIKTETKNDDTIQEVIRLSTQGWPECRDRVRQDTKPFFTARHDSLSYNKMQKISPIPHILARPIKRN